MSDARPTVYLVDGSGYIFRAFYALPQLNNSRGLPTHAVYGFARMLLKLLKDARPSHLAIVFDSPKKTFRDDLFASYKANRLTPPNDLVVQIPYIHRLVEAFRIRHLVFAGYEADDVIGTLASEALNHKFEVVIVTADKDFMQLVGPHLTLWDTMRDRRTGVREVRERLGVAPAAVVDLMALMGDPIDNVKGIPGVGEKTASALIQHFGSLDKLLADPAAIAQSGIRGAAKLAQLVAEHRGEVELARKLVRIEIAAPIELSPEQLAWSGIDEQALTELLRTLEFNSLLEELVPATARVPLAAAAETQVGAAELAGRAAAWAGAQGLALDLSQADSGQSTLRLKAIGTDDGDSAIFAINGSLLPSLRTLLGAAHPPRACHDLKRHLAALRRAGLGLGGVDFDTMLAGFLINPGRPEPSLEQLYHEHLAPLGGELSASAVEIVAALRPVLIPILKEQGLDRLFDEVEMPLAAVLEDMEAHGIGIDGGVLRNMAAEFSAQLERLEQECIALAGGPFNLNSPTQLREVLFTKLQLPTKGVKKTKSGFSTDVDVLTRLASEHQLPAKLLEYRAMAKLKSTYADALPALIDPADGRIHSSFHQALTATGRLSSTEPNLQNIPTRSEAGRRIRRAFVAGPGRLLLSADYSQIELRVLAHLSEDPVLLEAFARGEDIHQRTAMEILGRGPEALDGEARRLAKVINFGIIYGMGPQRLASELGIPLAEAAGYIERYFKRLPGVSAYLERCLAQARERGFVSTLLGRRRYLPELGSVQGGARAQAERIAVNTPIQGSAADLIKIAMVHLHRELKGRNLNALMVLQVHDELLFEIPQAELAVVSALAREQMEQVAQLRVPLRVELKWGPNWAELNS